MADEEQVRRLKESIEEWNQWRWEHPNEKIDLSDTDLTRVKLSYDNPSHTPLRDADLSGADLRRTDLKGVKLSKAILYKANLSETDMRGTDLSQANLKRASLNGTDLYEANLYGAKLYGAKLYGADLRWAHLEGANLDGTKWSDTIVSNIDLCQTKGLTTIVHEGPSTISLPTVRLPENGSSLVFLRGAGVPDEWIDFYRATMHRAIQYHSCFISYAVENKQLATRLHADLQNKGVRCWFAPHDLTPGNYYRKEIDQAIQMQDKLLLILSQESIHSKWVEYEVNKALNREVNQSREILFPIRIDTSVFESTSGWAKELREERHIGDFTEWESSYSSYEEHFTLLLKQLTADHIMNTHKGEDH